MGPLTVVLGNKGVEARLLLEHIGGSRFRGLSFEGEMHALVAAVLLRVDRGLEELTYPFHDGTFTVTQCGRICFKGRKVNLSHVFAGQNVGVTQVGERIWLLRCGRPPVSGSLSELDAKPIPGTELGATISNPVFSPDGKSIAFWSAQGRGLKRIANAGGAATTIATIGPSPNPFGMTWSGDRIVFGWEDSPN
jgi:hypothetical protein